MKQIFLVLVLGAVTTAAMSQSTEKPLTVARHPGQTAASSPSGVKLPPGVPPVRGTVKSAFSLRYQDVKIGAGAEAEPNQLYKVLYTGWLAADGRKFDSSEDHRQPVMGQDGKPVLDADGRPKLGDPQPISFPQGFGRVIPGFDQGFAGMKIGGKRRLFIPWQLAYGARGRPGPDPANPGIPAKADLIFDIELVDATDLPMPQNHPGMAPVHPAAPGGTAAPPPAEHPAAPAQAPQPAAPPQPQQ
jgi:peptidylprolyl isomerase